MVNKMILIGIALVALVVILYFALKAPGTAIQSNGSLPSLANSSFLSSFNGTGANASISNTTLNGSISTDQNESILSTANLTAPP